MCGILGYLPACPEPRFQAALDQLAHRGPDGEGVWHDPEGEISLGHRRLAILDLSEAAAQPMQRGDLWLTFNGEIYNFLEIRKELEEKGVQFSTDSDSEVLLAAYRVWGKDCLMKFNGMWALAIWDQHKKELFLARDRFGKKPLFYLEQENAFGFASEMKGLFPFLSSVSPALNIDSLSAAPYEYESTPACLVEGIQRFPAGHFGVYSGGKWTLHRWWNTLDHLEEVPENYEDQVARFRELFTASCRLRLRSDVPVGTALSGGLDSSSVIATLARIGEGVSGVREAPHWQHAFVATFPGTSMDESHYARQMTDHLGLPATFLPLSSERGLENLWEQLYRFEEIGDTAPLPMMEIYREVREQGIKVTLDGHGADELLAGYGESLFHAFPDAGGKLSSVRLILDAYNSFYPKEFALFRKPHASMMTWFRYRLRNLVTGSPVKRKPGLDHFSSHLFQLFHQSILPTLLRNYDRYSMASGVEIRMPFMDQRLVTYAFSLPWDSKLREGFTKKILRDACGPELPNEIRDRKSKIGFGSPTVEWMRKGWKTFFMDEIHSQSFRECDLIVPKKVHRWMEHVMEGENPTFFDGLRAWQLLSPYLWEQAVIKGRGKS